MINRQSPREGEVNDVVASSKLVRYEDRASDGVTDFLVKLVIMYIIYSQNAMEK